MASQCDMRGHEYRVREDSPEGVTEKVCIHCDHYTAEPMIDEAAKAEKRANIEKLKNKLARARQFAAQAENAYGEKYAGLMDAIEKARGDWERDNSLIVAEYERTKKAAEAADKDLRAELVAFYNATGEKRFDEHLSVRVNIKLAYEIEKATEWAKTNAPYMLIADKSQFEKHAKDKKVSLDFVTKKEDPSGVIASALPPVLPVIEDAQIDEQGAGDDPAARPGKWVVPAGESEQGVGADRSGNLNCPGCGHRPCICVPF